MYCRLGYLMALFLGVSAMTAEAAVYRWVDDQGKVHFGDRPPVTEESSPVTIKSKPGRSSAPAGASQAERRERQQKMLDAYADEREKKRQARKEKAEQKQKQKEQCARAQDSYKSYQRAGSFYKLDDQGKRRYYSKEEHEAILRKEAARVKKLCG